MGETLKRSISGIIYVLVMWFGVFYSQLSFRERKTRNQKKYTDKPEMGVVK
jgi:hypothetical protein